MLDFLFLYEHKARELENCVYLSEALKKKGFSVKIESILSFKRKLYRPRVIITPHLYDNNQVRYYTSSLWNIRPKVISMQYEQVLSASDRENNVHRPKDKAKKAYHVAWGENEYQEYLKNEIPVDNILKIGAIGMDFDTKFFSSFLPSKDDLSTKYNIPNNKKWCIFFSSFAYCGRTDEELDKHMERDVVYKLRNIMEETKPIILSWFEKAITTNPDIIIIYRRHPAERVGDSLNYLLNKYPNRFYNISELSIRPWIHACDYCCTWFSTSSIDAYYAGKPCYVLRPYPLDHDMEVEVMYDMKFIQTIEDFIKILCNQNFDKDFLFEKNVKKFFINAKDKLQLNAYINAFEYVLKEENNEFHVERDTFRSEIIECVLGILCDICQYVKISSYFKPFHKNVSGALSYYEKEVNGVNKEIKTIKKIINKFLAATEK